jgi:hypothetical protein
MGDDYGGWADFVGREAGVVEPVCHAPQPMKVKEDEGVFINPHRVMLHPKRVVHHIPGGNIGSFVLEHDDIVESGGPGIQVFLVSKPISFNIVITPLQALLPP